MKFHNQTIILTGGTSGIGLALLRALRAQGNRLVVVARQPERLRETAALFPDVVFIQADLAVPAEVAALAAQLRREYPAASVLINNAAVQYNYRLGAEARGEAYIADEIQINFTAAVQLIHALLPGLLAQPAAAIINMTSGLGLAPKQSAPVYCATKAGLQSFTKALRYQLEGSPVQVVDVVLPLVDTPMTAGRGQNKLAPEAVAAAVIGGVEGGATVLNIGQVKILRLVQRLLPGLADRVLKNS